MNFTELIGNLIDKLEGWLEGFILMLPNLAVAIVLMITFWGMSRLVRTLSHKVMGSVSSNRAVNRLITNVLAFVTLAIGMFVSLSILELDKAVTSLLAGAGVIGLALGFAFQDISANFMAGIFIGIRKPFKHGDHIQSNDLEGIVTDINLRNTIIKTFQGQEVLIPNKDVYQNPLINFTTLGERRVDLAVGVSYADDLEKVEKLTVDAVKHIDEVDKDRDVTVFYDEFGGSSINFKVRFWIDLCNHANFLAARSNAIKSIKTAYDKSGITIPFPIRTLDFGIEGGKSLKTMLVSDNAPMHESNSNRVSMN